MINRTDKRSSSGPSHTYPKRAYRNPLDKLVEFLDSKHNKNWAIWEFRAEGTGYPDDLVYNRILHYPWPDHHPPPFRLVPMIVASMRSWLDGHDVHGIEGGDGPNKQQKLLGRVIDKWKDKKNGRVVVVHCKAGKGRSGTMACSFLIAEAGWTPEEALKRFTERRMRPNFGPGVSIPSQLRTIGYVDRWTKHGKKYVDREVEIVEVHVWGLRNGVKLSVEGYADEGKKIQVFHTFKKEERLVVEGDAPGGSSFMDSIYDMAGYGPKMDQEILEEAEKPSQGTEGEAEKTMSPTSPDSASSALPARKRSSKLISPIDRDKAAQEAKADIPKRSKSRKDKVKDALGSNSPARSSSTSLGQHSEAEPGGKAVIFKPSSPIRIPNSDVNIALEKRNRSPGSMGMTMVTAVAHVWFNIFFEGDGPENGGVAADDGVFDIEWDKMDGIKGSSRKGTRAADKIAVVWRAVGEYPMEEKESEEGVKKEVPTDHAPGHTERPTGKHEVPQMQAADWKGADVENPGQEKKLGLRVQSPDSADVSQASSIKGDSDDEPKHKNAETGSFDGLVSDVPGLEKVKEKIQAEESTRGRAKEDDDEKLEAYAEKLPDPEGSESDKPEENKTAK